MISFEIFTSLLAICGMVLAQIYYIRGISNGRIKPHVFSWVIWGSLMLISSAVQFAEESGVASIPSFVGALLCLYIAWLAFLRVRKCRRKAKEITKTDWFCFCAALFSIPLWMVTDEPLTASVLITVIDVMAFVPTLRKTWHAPRTEARSMYMLSAMTDMMICLSVAPVTLASILYPASGLLTNGGLLLVIVLRTQQLKTVCSRKPYGFKIKLAH
jgi:hypothetical protein